jgi:glycerol-3-phosphate O-acyltransferase
MIDGDAIAATVVRRVGGNREEVARIVDGIAGAFSPLMYRAVVTALPPVVGRAFGDRFGTRVHVEGDLAALRELASRATLILAPTHASNLDSIVLGLVLARAGLPPFVYAAGKHIYRHRLAAFFMRRLGAYQLDPDRHDRLYLRTVHVYVNELVASGCHTVVFPSGTRCRSGMVEASVKLGLLGAAIQVARPIAIVPVTINYQIVLEAESLIAYYLAGRAHERIVGDELFVWGRLRDTARRLAALDQRVVIRFGESIDPHGSGAWRPRVSSALAAAYRRDTVLLATHVVARALHDLGGETQPISVVRDAIARTRTRLGIWRGLEAAPPDELLEEALAAWASWYRTPPALRRADAIRIASPDLLLFYANRSAHLS